LIRRLARAIDQRRRIRIAVANPQARVAVGADIKGVGIGILRRQCASPDRAAGSRGNRRAGRREIDDWIQTIDGTAGEIRQLVIGRRKAGSRGCRPWWIADGKQSVGHVAGLIIFDVYGLDPGRGGDRDRPGVSGRTRGGNGTIRGEMDRCSRGNRRQ